MAAKQQRKKEQPVETHETIAAQTAAFLKAGGKIQQIDRGVTGQKSLAGPKHLVLSRK